MTGKADTHVWLFQDNAYLWSARLLIYGFPVPRFQQEIKVRDIVAVPFAEIAEHSGFIGDHQQSAVFFKLMYKRFRRNIINNYPAKVACRDIADLCLELGNLLGGNIFLLFKSFELAF